MSRPFNNTKWWGICSLVLFSMYAWGQGLMNVVTPPSLQIGTASERYYEDGSGGNAYSNTLANEFNILTPENSMEWESIQPGAGQDPRVCSYTDATGGYDWTNADALVLWAQQNGKMVRGHNLVWGNQLPSWVYNYTSESDLAAIMQCHIQNVIDHYESLYQGIVVEWDVVNEPLTNASPWTAIQSQSICGSLPKDANGSCFEALALYYARQTLASYTDTTTLLFVNEQELDQDDGSNSAGTIFYQLIQTLLTYPQTQFVPGYPQYLVDGAGFQAHINNYDWLDANNCNAAHPNFNVGYNQTAFLTMAQLGLKIRVTEMDEGIGLPDLPPPTCGGYNDASPSSDQVTGQSLNYQGVIGNCKAAMLPDGMTPACLGVTFWGFTDKYQWLVAPHASEGFFKTAVLWDENFNKYSPGIYDDVYNALNQPANILSSSNPASGGAWSGNSSTLAASSGGAYVTGRGPTRAGPMYSSPSLADTKQYVFSAFVKATSGTPTVRIILKLNNGASYPVVATGTANTSNFKPIVGTYQIPSGATVNSLIIDTTDQQNFYVKSVNVHQY